MNLETVPLDPPSTVWAGELSPREAAQDDGTRDFFQRRLRVEDLRGELPFVSIGQPQVLQKVAGVIPPGFADSAPMDVYLVRLWCSFRDFGSDLQFDRAQFKATLSADGPPVVAWDLFPAEVLYKAHRDVKVSVGPELKFGPYGGKVGSLDYGFSYPLLEPAIVAAGQGESTATWVFSTTKGYRLRGGKAVHAVVGTTAGTGGGEATLDLVAYVERPGFLPLVFDRRGDVSAEPLTVTLW